MQVYNICLHKIIPEPWEFIPLITYKKKKIMNIYGKELQNELKKG
jgi:hypothetical protein